MAERKYALYYAESSVVLHEQSSIPGTNTRVIIRRWDRNIPPNERQAVLAEMDAYTSAKNSKPQWFVDNPGVCPRGGDKLPYDEPGRWRLVKNAINPEGYLPGIYQWLASGYLIPPASATDAAQWVPLDAEARVSSITVYNDNNATNVMGIADHYEIIYPNVAQQQAGAFAKAVKARSVLSDPTFFAAGRPITLSGTFQFTAAAHKERDDGSADIIAVLCSTATVTNADIVFVSNYEQTDWRRYWTGVPSLTPAALPANVEAVDISVNWGYSSAATGDVAAWLYGPFSAGVGGTLVSGTMTLVYAGGIWTGTNSATGNVYTSPAQAQTASPIVLTNVGATAGVLTVVQATGIPVPYPGVVGYFTPETQSTHAAIHKIASLELDQRTGLYTVALLKSQVTPFVCIGQYSNGSGGVDYTVEYRNQTPTWFTAAAAKFSGSFWKRDQANEFKLLSGFFNVKTTTDRITPTPTIISGSLFYKTKTSDISRSNDGRWHKHQIQVAYVLRQANDIYNGAEHYGGADGWGKPGPGSEHKTMGGGWYVYYKVVAAREIITECTSFMNAQPITGTFSGAGDGQAIIQLFLDAGTHAASISFPAPS